MTIAVVDVGGRGSLIVHGLAHLGAGWLLLVDPDTVEPISFNRLAGAILVDGGTWPSNAYQ